MRVLSTISTPWAPYSVTFSHDGNRLAIGGGSFYGNGGFIMASLLTGEIQLYNYEVFPPDEYPSVSGLCLSSDDSLLAASTWSGRHHYSPTFLFDVSDLHISHRETFVHPSLKRSFSACSSGVLLHRGKVITRHRTEAISEIFEVRDLPPALAAVAHDPVQHLTHRGIAVVRGTAVSGSRMPPVKGRSQENQASLVFAAPTSDVRRVWPLQVESPGRMTAIASTAHDELITGGCSGELDRWSWEGTWVGHNLRGPTAEKNAAPGLAWLTYRPNSVVAICSLSDGTRWVNVDASGELQLWADSTFVHSWQLPVFGTPRGLAAHPTNGWLAIGVKQGSGWGGTASVVLVVDVDED